MRKKRAEKREIIPDFKYNSKLVSKFINIIMLKGKKSIAQKIVYNAINMAQETLKQESGLDVFLKALENVKPQVKVKSRRVGGATYQIPVEIDPDNQVFLAINWMVQFSRKKKGKPMHVSLANELVDAYNNTGSSVKKKEDTHKMSAANKAFAHYRW